MLPLSRTHTRARSLASRSTSIILYSRVLIPDLSRRFGSRLHLDSVGFQKDLFERCGKKEEKSCDDNEKYLRLFGLNISVRIS